MNFREAIGERTARTQNGMAARATTANSNTDLFYKIGAMRGQDVIPYFIPALAENTDYALRIAQWSRDVRGGAGERQLFRNILAYLAKYEPLKAEKLLNKVPELGRWDDAWSVFGLNDKLDAQIVSMVANGLRASNGLLAKWLPRQSKTVNGKDFTKAVRENLGLRPAEYRKLIVSLSNTVEQKMCAREWNDINFGHVPSVAHARYKKAFFKNAESYKTYVESLTKGEAKINAGAVYPYDVIKGAFSYGYNSVENEVIIAQWEALPNYLGDNKILALVDVSGSMGCPVGGNPNLQVIDVAVSLGLYVADKLKGDFKDTFLTFSSDPELLHLKGNIIQKIQQMVTSSWDMSTDLHKAFELILKTAQNGSVSQEDMPDTLLIMSDMQFNSCIEFDDSAYQMIERKYREAGYEMPKIVFWNLRDAGNVPVKFDKSGVALVSGFSPAILKSLLSGAEFTPEGIMLETIMNDRYKLD